MSAKLRVLWSVREPGFDANPFVTSLAESVSVEFDVKYFSWRRALLSRYSLVHLHWPEDLFRAKSKTLKVPKYFLFLLLVIKLKASRTPVLWTVHNNFPHEGVNVVERLLLKLCISTVSQRVFMSNAQRNMVGKGTLGLVIRHGHYRGSYPKAVPGVVEREPRTILYFGFVRMYKGLERLVESFSSLRVSESRLRLIIAGRPNPQSYGDELHSRFKSVPGIEWLLGFQSQQSTSDLFATADLVVLPYKQMVNSGALLLGLSLGKRVLAPKNDITLEIQEEVGPSWLHLYEGELDEDDLANALIPQATTSRGKLPDLSLRDWKIIGEHYREAYTGLLCNGPTGRLRR